jgi:hypothetical protein
MSATLKLTGTERSIGTANDVANSACVLVYNSAGSAGVLTQTRAAAGGVAYTFNANTAVNSTADFITITGGPDNYYGSTNPFRDNDQVTYLVAASNTALTNLSNNTIYHVVQSNTSGVKLAATSGGAAINLTAGVTETGHSLTGAFLTVANTTLAAGASVSVAKQKQDRLQGTSMLATPIAFTN